MLASAWPAPAAAQTERADDPAVVIAVLPPDVSVAELASAEGIAPGVMSASLGTWNPGQTVLDIGQGNRIIGTLYDQDLPLTIAVHGGEIAPEKWRTITERAEEAPAAIEPGLLASTLEQAGIPVRSAVGDGLAPLLAADRQGEIKTVDAEACRERCPAGLTVTRTDPAGVDRLAATLAAGDLLVAYAAGTPLDQELWPIGVSGAGIAGNLTSDSTRREGFVSAIDIAPTVLEHFGLEVPDEMNGSAIRAEGERDVAAVTRLQERLGDRPNRSLVVLLPLGIWALAAALAAALGPARGAVKLAGLSCAWGPFVLLVTSALGASQGASVVAVALGAPALAGASALAVPGFGSLALACAATVFSHAVDVVVGSPFTALSELGPNPGAGARFFGIGNELEAALCTLTLVGAGAWLAARDGTTPRAAAAWFLGLAALAALAFAPGRFGADVGAAIVLGVGAATAAALAVGLSRGRATLLVVGAGLAGLAALVAIDLVLGGAHLSRSVLGAGEAGEVADVFERRITLTGRSFLHPAYPELLAGAGLLLGVGIARRERILGWFGGAWPARCGFLGALAGAVVGALANDSGLILLVIGTIYLAATAAFAWGNCGVTARPGAAGSAAGRPPPTA